MQTIPNVSEISSRSRRQAFTLVELLVVIGIIAVLIAIVLPVLGRVRENSKRIKCASNQRQIVLAIIMYANEHRQQLPGPCIACINDPAVVNPVGSTTSLMTTWAGDTYSTVRNLSNLDLLQRYVGVNNREIWKCPSATAMWETASPVNSSSAFFGRKLGYGYLVNNTKQTKSTYPGWLFGTYNRPENQPQQWKDSPGDWIPKKLNQIKARTGPTGSRVDTKDSTKIWLLTDLDGRNFGKEVSGAFGIADNAAGNTTTAKNKRLWQPVHRTKANSLPGSLGRNFTFLDGHTEYMRFWDWPNNDDNEDP